MEDIITLVSEFGLSVSLVIAFVFMFYKVFVWQREDGLKREERDRVQIEHFSQIISTNSKALLENAQVMEKISNNIENISDDINKLQDDVTEIKIRQRQSDDRN